MTDGAVCLRIGRFALRLSGLPGTVAGEVRERWDPFVADGAIASGTVLEVAARAGRGEARASGAELGEFSPKTMASEFRDGAARFTMPEGEIEIAPGGRAALRLRDDAGGRAYFTVANLLRAALAWWLPEHDAALVHAAGVVVGGRGFVLVGAEGAGKSTWARQALRGGAHVVSDDLVLIDANAGAVLVGAPFRSDYRGPHRTGAWPLAACLLPRRGGPAPALPAARLLARGAIAANLPFLIDALEHDPRVSATVNRLAAAAPWFGFPFAPDDPGLADRLDALAG